MNGWILDKEKVDPFMPEIVRLVAPYMIVPASTTDDQEHNTDLIASADTRRVACRVRSFDDWTEYADWRDEFTVREDRPSGCKSELTKIIEGWGDLFFYGFASGDNRSFVQWTLMDLRVFRLWFMRYLVKHQGKMPGLRLPNTDGSSTFRIFRFDALPLEFAVARGAPMNADFLDTK